MPRRDVKPIAKALIARFGSFAEVLAARPERLEEIAGLGEAAITELKIVEAAARRLAQSSIEKRRNLGSSSAVLDYCRTAMAYLDHEQFRFLTVNSPKFPNPSRKSLQVVESDENPQSLISSRTSATTLSLLSLIRVPVTRIRAGQKNAEKTLARLYKLKMCSSLRFMGCLRRSLSERSKHHRSVLSIA